MKQLAQARNLTSRIAHELGLAIVTGRYSKTNPFPNEADLARHFGASRTVLREAVKMLTAKGLLAARAGHGTWVQSESCWNLLDPDVLRWLLDRKISAPLLVEFTEMRLAVEPRAAAVAACVGTPQAKAEIRWALERMRAAELGQDDPLESDIAFHVAILRASGNRFYSQLQEMTRTALHFSIRATNGLKGVPLGSVEDHAVIADAIDAGDPVAAERAARVLIEEALHLFLRKSGHQNAVESRLQTAPS